MTNGGDAAEQVVRLSLEGFEVAAKLSGAAAKNIAVLLVSVLKQEQKTKGKARLTNMIKSGKELKVFSIPNKDLKKFTEQAKRYGVLYCLLRDSLIRSFVYSLPKDLVLPRTKRSLSRGRNEMYLAAPSSKVSPLISYPLALIRSRNSS